MIKLETKHAFLKENVKDYQESVDRLHQQLMNKECLGNDYVGWVESGRIPMIRKSSLASNRPLPECVRCAMCSSSAESAVPIWGPVQPSR